MKVIASGLLVSALVFAQTPDSVPLQAFVRGITNPTDIQAPAGDPRLFVLEQAGRIRVIENGTLLTEPFLDIRAKVASGGERGLLGLAFSPQYATTGRFYVNYTDLRGDTTISLFHVSADRNRADPAETVLLKIAQPFANHNGGQIRFGPDGYFYIGMGDGGSGGDPNNNAQNPRALLGKMLRYDAESVPGELRIPAGNPFADGSAANPAVWALGLRNPWRFSFDRATGDLWIADVGQNQYEEIDFASGSSRGGENYGWNRMEGLHCYQSGCDPSGFVPPVAEYDHSQGCSITGGFVYRGAAVPSLRGSYIYSDYCSGWIAALTRQGSQWTSRKISTADIGNVLTFGEDSAGEVYIGATTAIYRFTTTAGTGQAKIGAVVNAASNAPGLVAGSIATAYMTGVVQGEGVVAASTVPLPTNLGGVTVTVNGRPAPLFAVAKQGDAEQVNFQAPFETTGGRAAVVIARGGASTSLDMPVFAAQPGIFAANGTGAIVVRADDNSLVTRDRPLSAGDIVTIYATGLGPVTNPPPTGAATPVEPLSMTVATPRVTFAGVPAEVLFSGLAPGFAGLYQINLRVPEGVAAGDADIVLSVNNAASLPLKVPVR